MISGGQLDLAGRRGAERRAAGERVRYRRHHGGVGVPEDHRPPGADEVHVLAPVHVEQVRARGPVDEPGHPADRPERADRGVHAARGHLDGAGEQLGGAVVSPQG